MTANDLNGFDVLVDVRPEADYEIGHLPGAISLSEEALLIDAEVELPDKTASIGIYGANTNDQAAQNMATRLKEKNYQNITLLPLGAREWEGQFAIGPARWNIVNECEC